MQLEVLHGGVLHSMIATDEELGGAPSEGMDVASSSFPSITNRGLSNQYDLEINNKVNVENLWRLIFNRRGPAHTQPKYFAPSGGKVVNLSGLAENKAVNCIVKIDEL